MPEYIVVNSREEAREAMSRLKAPYVMKINSADILHKTDAGGVRLNIMNSDEGEEAFDQIISSCREYNPSAVLNGVLVQEMLESGTEMIVGIKNDQTFGPVVLVGMGGVFVEVFKDISLYPAPVSKKEALSMISELKAFKLLSGYRGGSEHDVDALCDLIVDLASFASENKDLVREIDLNPVFVYGKDKGVSIVDALVIENR